MPDPRKTIYQKQAETIIGNLQKHNMQGYYFETRDQAVKAVCGMIPKNSLVGMGGSETIVESGLLEALRKMKIRLLDRYKTDLSREEMMTLRQEAMAADVFISGTNAITQDGKLVNQDGMGSRVGAMIYGPRKVIVIVGMNKVVSSVEEGIARIRTVAAPINSIRVGVATPCSKTGFCSESECLPPDRICGQLTVIESTMAKERIAVVLVGESLGY